MLSSGNQKILSWPPLGAVSIIRLLHLATAQLTVWQMTLLWKLFPARNPYFLEFRFVCLPLCFLKWASITISHPQPNQPIQMHDFKHDFKRPNDCYIIKSGKNPLKSGSHFGILASLSSAPQAADGSCDPKELFTNQELSAGLALTTCLCTLTAALDFEQTKPNPQKLGRSS